MVFPISTLCLRILSILLMLVYSSEGLSCHSCVEDIHTNIGQCLNGQELTVQTCQETDFPKKLRHYIVCYSMTFKYKNFNNSYGARYGCFSTYDINRETSGCHLFETEPQVNSSAYEMTGGNMCFCTTDMCNKFRGSAVARDASHANEGNSVKYGSLQATLLLTLLYFIMNKQIKHFVLS